MAATPEQLAQVGFDIRVEWGPEGLERLAPLCDVIVVVDVLSFTTCVSVALEAAAEVLPFRLKDETAAAHAEAHGALLAGRRSEQARFSLSPQSLTGLPKGASIVLPSPNGSTLSFLAREHGARVVVAACLRNASAVAAFCADQGNIIGVIPSGERWGGADGPMRVALEDLLGAGAVVTALPTLLRRSPEAAAAAAVFEDAKPALFDRLAASPSGRELTGQGFGSDVLLAGSHDATTIVPVLDGHRYRPAR